MEGGVIQVRGRADRGVVLQDAELLVLEYIGGSHAHSGKSFRWDVTPCATSHGSQWEAYGCEFEESAREPDVAVRDVKAALLLNPGKKLC